MTLASGVALSNHRSCSNWTAPSMTCVITGNTPFDLGWWPWTSDIAIPGADPDLPTLALQLWFHHGYRTTLVTANSVFDYGLYFDRGFELVKHPSWQPADVVTDEALAQAATLQSSGQDFYLHVHYIDPHSSYCPPEEYIDPEYDPFYAYDLCADIYTPAWFVYPSAPPAWQEQFVNNIFELYDAELEFWDVEFGRLWNGLDAMGALDDTLVVFVTDHGEQIYERGSLGHGIALGSEENRSTGLFWAKNIVPQLWTGNTVHQDIGATLQDYFDIVPGTPSSGMVVGTAPVDRPIQSLVYWGPGSLRLSIAVEGKQLLYDFWGEKHFYDIDAEPPGLVDLYDPLDPDVIELWVPMADFAADVYGAYPSVGAAVDIGP